MRNEFLEQKLKKNHLVEIEGINSIDSSFR